MERKDPTMKHLHDDVIKWKHFPRYWPFVREIHRSPTNSPHKGPWRGVLMFSLICAYTNGWVNNREAGDRAHYDVIVMDIGCWYPIMLSKSVILLTASNLIRIQGTCHRILSIWWKNNAERSHACNSHARATYGVSFVSSKSARSGRNWGSVRSFR